MINFFNKYKNYLYLIGSIFIITLILSLIYLLGNVSYGIINILLLFIMIIFMFLVGILYSQNNKAKGIISGLKIGTIIIMLLFVLGLIFKVDFKLTRLIYYIILILSAVFGGIVGKNKR